MPKYLNAQQVVQLLRERREVCGSQKDLAIALNVSQQYLSDVMAGKRAPGVLILTPLGLVAEIVYRYRNGGNR